MEKTNMTVLLNSFVIDTHFLWFTGLNVCSLGKRFQRKKIKKINYTAQNLQIKSRVIIVSLQPKVVTSGDDSWFIRCSSWSLTLQVRDKGR